MQIHNAVITGSFSYNGADLSNVTSSNAYSASLSTRVSQIEQVYATTGSNSFRATQSITGSLTVTGQIVAQTLNVQQVTSSIVFSSGSNTFGCDLNSRQTFTGSVIMTGSLTVNTTGTELQVNNNGVILGNLATDNHSITGSLRVIGPTACFSSTLFGNIISGNAAAISGSGTFGTCMTNGDFTIISNSSPFVIRGRQTFDRGFLGLTWDISPDVGVMVGNSLGFNTNSIPGSTIGTRALTLACNGAATFASCITATQGIFSLGTVGGAIGSVRNLTVTNTNGAIGDWAGLNFSYYNNGNNYGYIGTVITSDATNAISDLVFGVKASTSATAVTEYMRIKGGGNVGIGTNNPTAQLQVSSASGGTISINSTVTNTFRGLVFQNNAASDGTEYAYIKYNATSGEFRHYANPAAFGGFTTWYSNNVESMRLNASGYLFVGVATNSGFSQAHRIKGPSSTENTDILSVDGGVEYSGFFRAVSGANYSLSGTGMIVGRNTSTGRSINAGGTINASGADYAEYMTKAIDITIAKGDIVGVNSQGKLTNIFEDSISFVVKSTDPSYVGGDIWGSVDNIGKLSPEATEEEKTAYNTKLETERAKVDRIAFSGQVPCNVTGANVGDYIIPIELENGKIGGQAVTNPTFEQYRISVGKVWKIMEDGRAWIAVKIG